MIERRRRSWGRSDRVSCDERKKKKGREILTHLLLDRLSGFLRAQPRLKSSVCSGDVLGLARKENRGGGNAVSLQSPRQRRVLREEMAMRDEP